MMIAAHKALAEVGVGLVELRVDWLARNPDLSRVIKERPTPIVVTCRRPQDGGRWRGPEEDRIMLLRQAIAAGVDYVDLETDIASKIPRFGKTKRIVSYHNFQETADNVKLLKLTPNAGVPTVAFCMGDFGIPSRILCGKYGAPFTYATFSKERLLAPGQLSFEDMRDIYHFDELNPETKVYGVIGDPIGHSWSPMIHNAAFKKAGLNAVYVPFRIPAEDLKLTLREFEWLDVQGYSVTIPHKEAVAEMVSHVDSNVTDSGAANTLYKNAQDKWCAINTDYEAALSVIREKVAETGGGTLEGKRVMLLGAGGVAKAIGLALTRAGAAITVTNRSKDRGKALAEQLKCQYLGWENRGTPFVDILVNCTPIGMFPDTESTPFNQNWLRDGMIVFDTIYNPETTLLLKESKTHFCHTISGLEMFVRQAAEQFECFTGGAAPVDVMRATLRKAISPVKIKVEKPPAASEEGSD